MTTERLRALIVEKQRPLCKGEPGPSAIANYLPIVLWDIFKSDEKQVQENVCETLRYENIDTLREDTTGLIRDLKEDLEPETWKAHFEEYENLL